MNRCTKVVFAISIVLNVLLAGMMLGDVSHHFMEHETYDISQRLSQLPPDKRALFERIMGPAKQQMDTEHAQIDAAKKEAIRLLKAEPFNEEAYLTLVRHIEDMHTQMKRHIAEAVANLAKQLTPQEREILAEIVSHPPFALPPGAMQSKPATTAL